MTWMIYGAYGYTGHLVAALAAERGELPVLAGRDEARLAALGRMLELEHRSFALSDERALRDGLSGIDVVAHCAGPFSSTAEPMIDACLDTRTHYLDITGEIDVLEQTLSRDKEARETDVALLPGAGIDVVPSDCLAALLARELPGATTLQMAIDMAGGISPGTAKTAMESMSAPSRARVGGVIADTPKHLRSREAEFPSGTKRVHAVGWGDIATAYHSTGIPNIVTYVLLPPGASPLLALTPLTSPLTRRGAFKAVMKAIAGRVPGPSAKTRARSRTELWAEASDGEGNKVSGTFRGINGYDITADSVVRIAKRLASERHEPGAFTPSQMLGAEFVKELDGAEVNIGV